MQRRIIAGSWSTDSLLHSVDMSVALVRLASQCITLPAWIQVGDLGKQIKGIRGIQKVRSGYMAF